MKKCKFLILLLIGVILSSCSDDDSGQTENDTINYKHEVIYVANDFGSSSSDNIFVKANHSPTQGNPVEQTKTITALLDKLTVIFDNSNNPVFTITNNGPTAVYIQLAAIRGDRDGNYPSPNEKENDFEIMSGESSIVIYNYNAKEYQLQ
ncbi:hypothetical protein [Thalassobellus suaedae]|uniref:Uncharacterized protein n=1 Tax=Thalassobellus suaedae TaxID=3074124 RepID=A0ABY9Y6G6_9FLAO|nr:hypothetical protein RHP49_06265 [Flavobacteriaceae bacterium HL-DH10]